MRMPLMPLAMSAGRGLGKAAEGTSGMKPTMKADVSHELS